MDTHEIRKAFVTCNTYQADCMLFGTGPLMKVFFNASKEAQNYDGQELKHYLPPTPCSTRKGWGVGEALGEGGKGTWEGTTPWY